MSLARRRARACVVGACQSLPCLKTHTAQYCTMGTYMMYMRSIEPVAPPPSRVLLLVPSVRAAAGRGGGPRAPTEDGRAASDMRRRRNATTAQRLLRWAAHAPASSACNVTEGDLGGPGPGTPLPPSPCGEKLFCSAVNLCWRGRCLAQSTHCVCKCRLHRLLRLT